MPVQPPSSPPSPHGLAVALIFAGAAQQVNAWYEHGVWLTAGQQVRAMGDWMQRRGATLPETRRLQLAELADTLAHRLVDSLSREAGLYAAHEMMEALNPRHDSDFARQLMQECERLLDAAPGVDDADEPAA